MVKQSYSRSKKDNSELNRLSRQKDDSDREWLSCAYDALKAMGSGSPASYIVLMGSKDIAAFRIRNAQSYLRADRLPSYWSDCGFLEVNDQNFNHSNLYCLPLLQPAAEGYAPKRNGLVKYSLNTIMQQQDFPNLALLAIPVAQEAIVEQLNKFQEFIIAYNAVENIIPWLAYSWGVGNANPLMQQIGLPSAMLLNYLYSANNYDLSPSVSNQLSTPEVFWNGVKNWSEFYMTTGGDQLVPRYLFTIDHEYDIEV